MTSRLPFTLTPLPGEPFGLWWHIYAARLGVTRTELAHAVGIAPANPSGPGSVHAVAIAAATGLPTDQVTDMFTTPRCCPPEHVLRVWAPRLVSRFCPSCLANGSRLLPEWSLPATFSCLIHHQPLVETCPGCGQPPPSRIVPRDVTVDPSNCPLCGHDLTAADRRAVAGARTNAKADTTTQEFINTLLARLRDPGGTAGDRQQAQDDLTDFTLIALHLTQGEVDKQRGFTQRMPDAEAFAEAISLLTTPGTHASRDRLVGLVARCSRGPRSRAIPFSWRAASPALITWIARGRDTTLTPIERIRYATTLPTPCHNPASPPIPHRAGRSGCPINSGRSGRSGWPTTMTWTGRCSARR